MQQPSKGLRIIIWVLGIIAGLVAIGFVGINLLIGLGVDGCSHKAMALFNGDRVEALIAQVDCQTCSLRDRNHAVWALGQLRDKRALPVLHKYCTGRPCSHRTRICQYELSKAIKWTEGNSFMLPQLWRLLL